MQSSRHIVTFIGPEGSGKTTMAKLLAKETGKPYITTGDTLRQLAAEDPSPLGDECRKMFAEKTYLSGKTLIKILEHRFGQADTTNGLILDGGFRTVEETKAFPKMLKSAKRNLPVKIIYLQIPYLTSYQRLVWGRKARKRKDDTLYGVYMRLTRYHHRLAERLKFIQSQANWELIKIDATAEIGEVYKRVRQALVK